MSKAVVHLALAPQRKEPNHRSELVNQLLFGEQVEILDRTTRKLVVGKERARQLPRLDAKLEFSCFK